MSSNSYFLSADITRIVAIIAVVAIHVSTPFVDYPPYFQGFSWWIANFIDSASRVAVPLFIMLSGFLLLHGNKPSNIKRRLTRIGIPLLIWNGIFILWNIFFWFKTYTPESLIVSLIRPDIYHHLYFLNIMVGLYLIIPLLKKYIKKIPLKTQYLLLGLFFFFIIIITLNNYFTTFIVSFNAFTLFIPYSAYFLSGYYLHKIKINKKHTLILLSIFSLLVLVTAIGNYHYMKVIGWSNQFQTNARYDRYFYDYFNPIIIVMSMICFILLSNFQLPNFMKNNKKVTTLIQFLAATSFGIFLLHPIVLDLMDRYIPTFNIANISTVIGIVLLIKIMIVFLLSLLLIALWEVGFKYYRLATNST